VARYDVLNIDLFAIPSQVVEHLRLGNKRSFAPIALIDSSERLSCTYA
jgi:hypothetical protein